MTNKKENELEQMSFFNKIFVSKKAFRISTLVAVICFLYDAYVAFRYNETGKIFCVVASGVLIATLICLESCSRNYRDNAVKSIIGVLLGIIFAYDLRCYDIYYSGFSRIGVVLGAVKIALGIALLVLYLLARDSKRSNRKLNMYVRIAFITLALFVVLNNLPYFVADFAKENPHFFIQDVARTLAFICSYFSVVCAACTVDRYKMIRDYYTNLGEWTKELRGETKKELFGKSIHRQKM